MRVGVAACVFLLMGGCAGCKPPTSGSCDPAFYSQAVPSALGLAPDGSYAFVAATWYYRPDPCEPEARFGGAIHFVDLSQPTPEVLLSGVVPFFVGPGALVGGEFLVLPGGTATQEGIPPAYLVARSVAPSAMEQVALTSVPTDILGVGGEAFVLLPDDDEVLVHGSGADLAIGTITSPEGLAATGGHLYVSGPQGQTAEIEIASRSETRRLDSCPNSGPTTAVGPDSILLACDGGGLGLLLQDGTFSVLHPEGSFVAVSGKRGLDRLLVSTGPDYETRLLVLGSGLSAEFVPRMLDDTAVFGSSSAYAVAGGVPRTFDLLDGSAAPIPGFPFANPEYSQIDGLSPGTIAITSGESAEYQLFLVLIESATGEILGEPIALPPPSPDTLTPL